MQPSFYLSFVSLWIAPILAIDLNIVAIGASITFGFGSSQGNGYRDDMVDALEDAKHTVKMLGTQHGGSYKQDASEGFPGFTINQEMPQILNDWTKLQAPPNVIVTLVGTNDLKPDSKEIDLAPARYDMLLNVYRALCPTCVIVASALPPNGNEVQNNNIINFNNAVKTLIAKRQNAGEHILFSDGNSGLTVAHQMASDKYHPNDEGYKMIGLRFADQIKSAISKGWTKTPQWF